MEIVVGIAAFAVLYVFIGFLVSTILMYLKGPKALGDDTKEKVWMFKFFMGIWPLVLIGGPFYIFFEKVNKMIPKVITYIEDTPLRKEFKALYDRHGNLIPQKHEAFVQKYGRSTFERSKERYLRSAS